MATKHRIHIIPRCPYCGGKSFVQSPYTGHYTCWDCDADGLTSLAIWGYDRCRIPQVRTWSDDRDRLLDRYERIFKHPYNRDRYIHRGSCGISYPLIGTQQRIDPALPREEYRFPAEFPVEYNALHDCWVRRELRLCPQVS